VTTTEPQTDLTADTILRAGQLVDGKYRVEHLLGAGGMAAVWAGTNERMGKQVALKVILRSLATTRLAQGLFHREVLAASMVNHPNVVTVFDVVEHEGMACIVMELLEGEPLGSYIERKGFLGVHEATRLLLPAMRGVGAANSQGVIHRDLKPQNIFICMEPDGRIVTTKVLDFGIAVMQERGTDPSARLPFAMGTPAYMSPEHILGVPDIDGRADVYGFGLLLYESLTGQMAFPGELNAALFDHVLHRPAVPVTMFRPDLPAGLVRIIEKAMAKDRNQRYSDVNLMVEALEDELTPPTSAPHFPTPQAGVPSSAMQDPQSGPHGPRAVVNREPSGPHQGTQILFTFPLKTEGNDDATLAGPNGGNAGSNALSKDTASLPTTDRKAAVVDSIAPLRETRSRGLGVGSVLRGWGGLVGAGMAVAIGIVWVAVAMRGPRRLQTSALPAKAPVAQPLVLGSSATVDPAVVTSPLTQSASPPDPNALAARSHPVRPVHVMPVQVTPKLPVVAVRKALSDVPPRQHDLHGASWLDKPAQEPFSARMESAPAKPPVPRAGSLSPDDF
jgi:serine/threonine-protein kinase